MPKSDGWSEFGGYMSAKIQKLNGQFNNGVSKQISDIFSGICIFVNGLTDPPDDELRKIMIAHGGRFCHYFSKDTVTHVIASNLTTSKINKLTNEKVVKPNWIVDSVQSGKLLDWSDYELYGDRHNSDQSMMKKYVKISNCEGKEVDTGVFSLNEFYSKSRLHHLSSWANQLNNYLQQIKMFECEKTTDPELIFPGRKEFIDYYNSIADKNTVIISEAVLMHVDMDCFFVSVGIRNIPELIGVPVVVTHSSKDSNPSCSTSGSMSEIASCSYEARQYGIRNGMHLGKAQKLCPNLKTIPYDFESYLEVAKILYKTASRFTHDIQVGSCDELYMNLIDILKLDNNIIINPLIFARYIRTIIKTETGCPASCGIGGNLLTCKLATKQAKPNGQIWLKTSEVIDSIKDLNVRDLVGIGRNMETKLNNLGVVNCGQLQQIPLDKLKSEFGIKLGQRLYDICRGKDNRSIKTDRIRKSISAEINYGIRLQSFNECENLLRKLSDELSKRLIEANMFGSLLVLKLMIRHPEASVESVKYLGHGVCDNLSRSAKLPDKINDSETISNQAIGLYRKCNQDVKDLRGVGLIMQKLESSLKVNSESKKISNYFLPTSQRKNSNIKEDLANIDPDGGESDHDIHIEDNYDDDCLIMEYCKDDDKSDDMLNLQVFDSFSTRPFNEKKRKKFDSTMTNKPLKSKRQVTGATTVNVAESKPQQLTINNVFSLNSGFDSLTKKISFPDSSTDTDTIDFLTNLGLSAVGALKEAICQWVYEESVPDIEDCVLIRNQLASMVDEKVTDVHESIIMLKVAIDSKHGGTENEDLWTSCYDNIVQVIQKKCFKHYGAFLEFD